jgi:hypothetical protein
MFPRTIELGKINVFIHMIEIYLKSEVGINIPAIPTLIGEGFSFKLHSLLTAGRTLTFEVSNFSCSYLITSQN